MALVHERRSSLLVDRARREERSLDTQLLGMAKAPGHERLGHHRSRARRLDATLLLRLDAEPLDGKTLDRRESSLHPRSPSDVQDVPAARRWRRLARRDPAALSQFVPTSVATIASDLGSSRLSRSLKRCLRRLL